jgi:uncharacterized protein YceH (UPF0502 family)
LVKHEPWQQGSLIRFAGKPRFATAFVILAVILSRDATNMSTEDSQDQEQAAKPPWQPLSSRQRRVLGVLVEKAKTTPDGYPMSLNALTNGCNQKSNRSPQMGLKPDEVEDVLDELRAMGAVAEIQGGGRVPKYRHYVYEWLGVDKHEVAVMAELMLRGEQTVGELRTRASRMGAIPDQAALKTVLDSLKQKGLLMELTPPGRGQIVTHALYKERELADVQSRHAGGGAADDGPSESVTSYSPAPSVPSVKQEDPNQIAELRSELEELRELIERLTERVERIETVIG